MDGPQVLEVILLGQDEDHSVVTVSATRMYLSSNGLRWIIELLETKLTGREQGLSRTTSSSER